MTALSATYARQAEAAPALIATTGDDRRARVRAARRHPQRLLRAVRRAAHGVDERVYLPSVVQTAQVLALFIRDWCGVTG